MYMYAKKRFIRLLIKNYVWLLYDSGRLRTSTEKFMPEATEDLDDRACDMVEDPAFCFLAGKHGYGALASTLTLHVA